MPSDKQLRANRENASRSTGPRTPEGLAASSRNALAHGLLSRDVVLPEEDIRAFHDLLDSFSAEFQPVGPLEQFLVHQLAAAQWRLARLARLENGLMVARLERVRQQESNTDDDEEEEEVEVDRYRETTRQLGTAFYQDSDNASAFAKLSRYESAIRRSFSTAVRELRRAQTLRAVLPAVPAGISE